MQTLFAYIQPAIALYELSKDGIMVVGLDGKILYTNPAILELFSYENDEVKGKTVLIFGMIQNFVLIICLVNCPSMKISSR
ncbi:MAG: PAS domain S-box protein [Bacteroidetes bacterium]|nr:PAS domain S-box protein [Bacteroidota bacterium]